MESVITRVAPSPTGNLHIGTVRVALFNYLFARKHGGTFIVRIEDTDTSRSTPAYERNILEGLAWLQLSGDKVYRQSERTELYTRTIAKLLERDRAYRSKEPARDGSGNEIEVIRLRNPGTSITFMDEIRGKVTFDTAELGDFVIARSMHEPLYHLAVVVDDADMGITHVIRGEDHISNTPRQMLIQQALGYSAPTYAHVPLILASDRSKLSKRKGTTSVHAFREQGYLPEALINYLALLGWNPGTDTEIFSLEELVEVFDLSQVQKGGAMFDEQKLRWFNREYLGRMDINEFHEYAKPFLPQQITELPRYTEAAFSRMLPLIAERIDIGADITRLVEEGELHLFFEPPTYAPELLIGKDGVSDSTQAHISEVSKLLNSVDNFSAENVKKAVWDYAEREGKGAVLWPMRVALSGRERSPDPFSIASILGKQETLNRLRHAYELLTQNTS